MTEGASGGGRLGILLSSAGGLGHVTRVLAVLERLPADVEVDVVADVRVHRLIDAHLRDVDVRFRVLPLDYLRFGYRMWGDPRTLAEPCELAEFERINRGSLDRLRASRVVVNDFLRQAVVLRDVPVVGMFHGDLRRGVDDDVATAFWKSRMSAIAGLSDLFVRLTFAGETPADDPQGPPVLSSLVPVRRRRRGRRAVLDALGLDAGERFVAVLPGRGAHAVPLVAAVERAVAARTPAPAVVVVSDDPFGQDIVAEADLVVAKPGAGVLAECMTFGTPLVLSAESDPERRQVVRQVSRYAMDPVAAPDATSDRAVADAIGRAWADRRAFWRVGRRPDDEATVARWLSAVLLDERSLGDLVPSGPEATRTVARHG